MFLFQLFLFCVCPPVCLDLVTILMLLAVLILSVQYVGAFYMFYLECVLYCIYFMRMLKES